MTKVAKATGSGPGKYIVWLIAALWTVPTIGLLISSFRPEDDIKTSGWWTWFGEPGNVTFDNYSSVLSDKVGGQPFSYVLLEHRAHRRAGRDHPDRGRLVRRLRPVVDALQGP